MILRVSFAAYKAMEGTAKWTGFCLVANELPASILEHATRDVATR
jgi:hypothetical protein